MRHTSSIKMRLNFLYKMASWDDSVCGMMSERLAPCHISLLFLACSNIWWKLIIFVLALSPRVICFNSQSDVSSTHTQIERKSRLQNAPMMSEKRRLLPIKSERKMKGNLARTKNAQTAQSRSLPSDFFTYICEV